MERFGHIWGEISLRRRIIWLGSGLLLLMLTAGNYYLGGSLSAKITSKTNLNANVKTTEPPPAIPGMTYVAGNKFKMGRSDGKNEAEKPAREIAVNSFYIDLYEVTNQQYSVFVNAEYYRKPVSWKGGIYPKGRDKFPVVGVNWENAAAYCKYRGKRLPTEEEWEFAARGLNNNLYPWGNDWKPGNANAGGASKALVEVGKFGGRSPFGLYDMVGNAWEWTASDFKAYPGGRLPDVFAGKRNLKTIRGGSFETGKEYATTTNRSGWSATDADNYDSTGFRCAKDAER